MATSETPNRVPAAAPSMTPWWWSGAPRRGPEISSAPITSMPGLEGDHAGQRVGGVRAVAAGQREDEEEQAGAVMPTPSHWRAPTWKPNTRSASTARSTTPVESTAWTTDSGRERERGDVEDPGAGGDRHADREPARGEQRAPAAERMAHVHRGRRVRAPVLVEEAQLGGERAGEREEDAQVQGHWIGSQSSAAARRVPSRQGFRTSGAGPRPVVPCHRSGGRLA